MSAPVSGCTSVKASDRPSGDHDVGNWFHGLSTAVAALRRVDAAA